MTTMARMKDRNPRPSVNPQLMRDGGKGGTLRCGSSHRHAVGITTSAAFIILLLLSWDKDCGSAVCCCAYCDGKLVIAMLRIRPEDNALHMTAPAHVNEAWSQHRQSVRRSVFVVASVLLVATSPPQSYRNPVNKNDRASFPCTNKEKNELN